MTSKPSAGTAGDFLLGGDLPVRRIGYGAMQLAGPGVFGPPADTGEAIAVLRRAVELGVNHIDTADFYGPYVVNELIREALHPYPEDLVLVTKVGARRDAEGGWPFALAPDDLRTAVHENLRRLGVDRLDLVNLRVGDDHGSIAEPFAALAELREQGLIRHLGISNMNAGQLAEARGIAPVACVQNHYNLVHRADDALLDACSAAGIAFVPFFPLGGFTPLHDERLGAVATRLGATPMQVALAWLLARSPSILVIPGTSSRGHLDENVAAGELRLDPGTLAELDAMAG
ncbi:oxidoreductase [Amycolatopsis nigrescens]|uniref:oxidoreductase n=1 Tax=Amycolatopsis nigrescens TaxID=381445 RepID=UPI00037EF359|nr:oxidoreductase [Amycolatopsis nigrescens]